MDVLLQNLHDIPENKNIGVITINNNELIQLNHSQIKNLPKTNKKKNYRRLIKRLKYKFRLSNNVLRKSDKSKVFHIGRIEDYKKKSEEYMNKTKEYKCLGKVDPLPDLIKKTNKYLLDLRLAKWISQKQYELLPIKSVQLQFSDTPFVLCIYM